MGLNRRHRTPLGALYRSPLGAWGAPGSSYYVAGRSAAVNPHQVLWHYKPNGSVGVVVSSAADTTTLANSVVVDRAGNVYVITINVSIYKILKYNSAGALVASVTGGGQYLKLTLDQSGNVYAKGNRLSGSTDPTLFKFDSSLNLLWSVDVLGQGGRPEVGPSGDVYVCNGIGTTTVSVGGNIGRVTPSGSVVWQQWLGIPGRGATGGVAVDPDENVYVGTVRDAGRNVWKLDQNGNLLWTYDLVTLCTAVAVDAVGGLYVGSSAFAGVVTKLDYNGNFLWSYTANDSTIQHITADANGSRIYVAGSRNNSIPATVWVLKGSDGSLIRTHDTGTAFTTESSKSIQALRTPA